ncbi:hypothetical protein NE634_16215 [Lacrimispora saccharolytica]|nr:hypothetical protein [Lacrimispora saccharolytica]
MLEMGKFFQEFLILIRKDKMGLKVGMQDTKPPPLDQNYLEKQVQGYREIFSIYQKSNFLITDPV